MLGFEPEGRLINCIENRAALNSPASLKEAMREGKILEGRALVCTSDHDLIVDLGCMRGIIPREEGAIGIREGKIRDIAILSRVNRPVSFIVTDIEENENGQRAILSRRKAQNICMESYLSKLNPGDIIDTRVTHLEPFGAFLDVGCGISALMPIDCISISRINHPRERFSVGMDLKAVVKSIENGRITLTEKELLGTWEENAARFSPGQTVAGVIRSVEPYGIFVELTPNLAGLAESRPNILPGQQASVYIKNILPSRMKVKLVIIDAFDQEWAPKPPEYFFSGSHMDRFTYSPSDCPKRIETIFSPEQNDFSIFKPENAPNPP